MKQLPISVYQTTRLKWQADRPERRWLVWFCMPNQSSIKRNSNNIQRITSYAFVVVVGVVVAVVSVLFIFTMKSCVKLNIRHVFVYKHFVYEGFFHSFFFFFFFFHFVSLWNTIQASVDLFSLVDTFFFFLLLFVIHASSFSSSFNTLLRVLCIVCVYMDIIINVVCKTTLYYGSFLHYTWHLENA